MPELRADDALEFGDQPLVDALVEERKVFPVFATPAGAGRRAAAVRPVIVLDIRTSGWN
jgi:hypothetical protein